MIEQILSPLSTYFPYIRFVKTMAKYDPLSTLVKLALLQIMPIGTKLSFKKHSFTFEEPGLMQSIQRRAYGEDHTDLANLEAPIILATVLYDPKAKPSIKIIFEEAIKGLRQLITTYNPPQDEYMVKKVQSYKQTQASLFTYIGYLVNAINGQKPKADPSSNATKLWQDCHITWIAEGLKNMQNEHEWKITMNAIQVFVNNLDSAFAEEMENQS